MDIAATKLELLDWVMHLTNTEIFEKLLALKASTSENEKIVGYTALGKPLNTYLYIKHIEEGVKDIKEGRLTSHDDFLNEMKSW